ncbi:MAG: hypothetical protein E7365_00855 [Clostridiales bacterium]|nr:hypothetical protein [Clostridiales bacterium]
MKDFLKFILKLFLTFVATSVIAFISMMMCLSADIDFSIKMIFGLFFIAFILYLAFNAGRNKGEDDTKNNVYKSYKGLLASFLTMIPAIVLTILYMALTYKGWNGDNRIIADMVYMILYLIFLSFTPVLSSFVSFNPAFSIDFAQPAITILKNITTPNAVFAPMFFIPAILFIVAVSFGYFYGHKDRKLLKETVNKLKNNK